MRRLLAPLLLAGCSGPAFQYSAINVMTDAGSNEPVTEANTPEATPVAADAGPPSNETASSADAAAEAAPNPSDISDAADSNTCNVTYINAAHNGWTCALMCDVLSPHRDGWGDVWGDCTPAGPITAAEALAACQAWAYAGARNVSCIVVAGEACPTGPGGAPGQPLAYASVNGTAYVWGADQANGVTWTGSLCAGSVGGYWQ